MCLDLRRIEYLAHWITPVGPPRRYDTRFFVVRAPEGQRASHDQSETTDLRWLRPGEALLAHDRGEIEMVMPTIRNLQAIAGYFSVQDVLAFASSLEGIVAMHAARHPPRRRDGHSVCPATRDTTTPRPKAPNIVGCSLTESFASIGCRNSRRS